MKRSLLLLSMLALTGCPEPPSAEPPGGAAAGGPGAPPPGGQGGGEAPPQGGDGGGEAGPPPTGEGAGPANVPPVGGDGEGPPAPTAKYTQEELASNADAVTLSGALSCATGAGPYHVHLYPPPPDEPPSVDDGDLPEPVGPTVTMSIETAGDYSLKVPKGDYIVLAFEDANGDEAQSPGETMMIANDGDPVSLGSDKSLDIDCEDDVPPEMPGSDAAAPIFHDDDGNPVRGTPEDGSGAPGGPDGGAAGDGPPTPDAGGDGPGEPPPPPEGGEDGPPPEGTGPGEAEPPPG